MADEKKSREEIIARLKEEYTDESGYIDFGGLFGRNGPLNSSSDNYVFKDEKVMVTTGSPGSADVRHTYTGDTSSAVASSTGAIHNGQKVSKCGSDSCYCTSACLGNLPKINPFEFTGGDNVVRNAEGDSKPSDMSVRITADVGEALTGFKALQRELRETTKAARELEQAYKDVEFRLTDWRGDKVCYCGNECGNNSEDVVVEIDGRKVAGLTIEALEEEITRRKRMGLR